MKKTLIGQFEDGSPHYLYEAEGDEVLIRTGPIVAVLQTSDGTSYDVSDAFVAVPEEHHDELMMAIGEHYEANGHPDHTDPANPFKFDRKATEHALAERKKALKAASKRGNS